DAVRHGKTEAQADGGCRGGELVGERDDTALGQVRASDQRSVFAPLAQQHLGDFVDHDRRDDQVVDILDGAGEVPGAGCVGEVGQPGGGIDDVHTRSAARSRRESMPATTPRSSAMGRSGTSSMRPWWSRIWTFWPGVIPTA